MKTLYKEPIKIPPYILKKMRTMLKRRVYLASKGMTPEQYTIKQQKKKILDLKTAMCDHCMKQCIKSQNKNGCRDAECTIYKFTKGGRK